MATAAVAAGVLIWAGYQFSIGPLYETEARPHAAIDERLGADSALGKVAYATVEAPVYPAPEFFRGIGEVVAHNDKGHLSYLLGERRQKGWWYFYPVALAVKTPMAFLALAAIGVWLTLSLAWRGRTWPLGVPAICAITVLLAAMPSNINIGVRHILLVYPLLSVAAGVAVAHLLKLGRYRWLVFSALATLFGWQLGASYLAHPDYLAYFNETVRDRPEEVLIDSDLDWGQDVERLAATMRRLKVDTLSIAVVGSAQLKRHGLPKLRLLPPYQRTGGWIAVSVWALKVHGGYSWLEAYEPVATVGKSIRVYHLPNDAGKGR
jgi:hypothetical protein